MRCFRRVLAVVCLVGVVVANPASPVEGEARGMSRNSIQTGDDIMDSIYSDCLRKDSVSCVKYKLFSFMDKMMSSKDSFSITEGVTIVKSPDSKPSEGAPRSLDDEKNDDIETMLVNRVERFLETHTIKMDLKGTDVLNAVSNAGRALGDAADSLGLTEGETAEEARGKKKKAAKILLPLLLAFKLKAAALIPLALGAIALIAGKALLIGKIALVLSAIIGLKKLLHHQKSVTYEIVSHPHHTSSHSTHEGWSGGGDYGSSGSGGHGGWGRAATDAQDMAYRAYQPQQ